LPGNVEHDNLKLCPTHHAARISRTVAGGMETDKLWKNRHSDLPQEKGKLGQRSIDVNCGLYRALSGGWAAKTTITETWRSRWLVSRVKDAPYTRLALLISPSKTKSQDRRD
jgi:hypothetical protein